MFYKKLRFFCKIFIFCIVILIAPEITQGATITQTTQEDFNTGIKTGVETRQDGSVTLIKKNYLENASFEIDNAKVPSDVDGLAESWSINNPSKALWAKELDTGVFAKGAKSQKISFTAVGLNAINLMQAVKRGIDENTDYTFSAEVKVDDISKSEIKLKIDYYGNSNVTFLKSFISSPVSSSVFTRMSISGLSPIGADTMRVMIVLSPKSSDTTAILWADGAQVEKGNTVTDFLDTYNNSNGEYVSAKLDMGSVTNPVKLRWASLNTNNTNLEFQIRSATTETKLDTALWYGPTSATDFYTYYQIQDKELLSNSSLENDANNDGMPDNTRKVGNGTNDRLYSIVNDAHSGAKATKVEITNFTNGAARWEVLFNGAIEKESYYSFGVWHKENADIGDVSLSVGLTKTDNTEVWGYANKNVATSNSWKQDFFIFKTPSYEINKIWVKIVLNKAGFIVSDDYSLKKINVSMDWPINSVHNKSRWIQYKTKFSTADLDEAPFLYEVEIDYGSSAPDIHWLNVMSNDNKQKYAFKPGQTAYFSAEVADDNGYANISDVNILVIDPDDKIVSTTKMTPGNIIDSTIRSYTGSYLFPSGANLGIWKARIKVTDIIGLTYSEDAIIRIKNDYTVAPQNMVLGALATDYGFGKYKNVNQIINEYNKYEGMEIWKIGINWSLFEPEQGVFDEQFMQAIAQFMDAAQNKGAKVQIGIMQQNFPAWVNNGNWDNRDRYNYDVTKRLADTWKRLSLRFKDHSAFRDYLIINEENYVYDADVYLRGIAKVVSAIRSVDSNINHRITVRPNSGDSFIRSRIAQDGMQDQDYGTGGYPTGSAWWFDTYENPLSETSFLRMARLRKSPLSYGGVGAIGEIGFGKEPADNFGDEEKFLGFARALSIAYDQGMSEYMFWGGSFALTKPEVYFPKLKDIRDKLIKQPRINRFNVRVFIDNAEPLYREASPVVSKLVMSNQAYRHLVQYLDENGYSWFYTHSDAESLQKTSYDATISFSEIKGKTETDQDKLIAERLKNVKKNGGYYYWDSTAGTIKGIIKDNSNNPIAGATVSLGAKATVSDNDGVYTITRVPAGNYTLNVQKTGYNSSVKSGVEVTVFLTNTVDFTLASSSLSPTSADLSQPPDGKVNAQDFAILMSAWNSIAKPKADINQDGLVDSLDFGLMMSFWG